MAEKKVSKVSTPKKEIKFNYIKSNFFRVVHVDGAWGGITAQGKIHMTFYNERVPIPQQTIQPITPEGTLGNEDESRRITKQDFVRELEVDAVMDLEVAKVLVSWLNGKIRAAEKLASS